MLRADIFIEVTDGKEYFTKSDFYSFAPLDKAGVTRDDIQYDRGNTPAN